jgi:hypothetical protein
MPAARVGDMAICSGPPDKAAAGSATVMINGEPAARMGDSTGHGGVIMAGCPTVLIGDGGSSGGAAATPAVSGSHLPKAPQSKEEVLKRMDRATRKVQECRDYQQELPQSPYGTADKLKIVEEGLNEKFIVRVTKTKYAGDNHAIGNRPEGATTATYWTTTYTQLEHADRDAQLITQSVGVDYDPEAEYTLLLIDQEKAWEAGDMLSFIPTYSNLGKFAQTEIADEFEGKEVFIEPCLTPEYSEYYEQLVNTSREQGYDLDNKRQFNDLTKELGFDENQVDLLSIRHQMKQVLGANEQFLGNGMTRDNTAENPEPPFGEPKALQAYGPVETFTYDKNPMTLGQLEKAGIVTRIGLNGVKEKA